MRLALLIGVNPLTFKDSPVVRIPAGSWAIRLSGIAESKLSLLFNGSRIGLDREKIIELDKPETVKFEFDHRGSERYISIFADSISLKN